MRYLILRLHAGVYAWWTIRWITLWYLSDDFPNPVVCHCPAMAVSAPRLYRQQQATRPDLKALSDWDDSLRDMGCVSCSQVTTSPTPSLLPIYPPPISTYLITIADVTCLGHIPLTCCCFYTYTLRPPHIIPLQLLFVL